MFNLSNTHQKRSCSHNLYNNHNLSTSKPQQKTILHRSKLIPLQLLQRQSHFSISIPNNNNKYHRKSSISLCLGRSYILPHRSIGLWVIISCRWVLIIAIASTINLQFIKQSLGNQEHHQRVYSTRMSSCRVDCMEEIRD